MNNTVKYKVTSFTIPIMKYLCVYTQIEREKFDRITLAEHLLGKNHAVSGFTKESATRRNHIRAVVARQAVHFGLTRVWQSLRLRSSIYPRLHRRAYRMREIIMRAFTSFDKRLLQSLRLRARLVLRGCASRSRRRLRVSGGREKSSRLFRASKPGLAAAKLVIPGGNTAGE